VEKVIEELIRPSREILNMHKEPEETGMHKKVEEDFYLPQLFYNNRQDYFSTILTSSRPNR
jgi:hypothetical protein